MDKMICAYCGKEITLDDYRVYCPSCKLDYHKDCWLENNGCVAENCEYNINECRNHLREEHIVNIENSSYNYLTGVYYMDVLSELEKIGDFLINISQANKRKHDNQN